MPIRKQLLLSILTMAGLGLCLPATAQEPAAPPSENSEYMAAVAANEKFLEDLKTYHVQGRIHVENVVAGQPQSMSMDLQVEGAASWPDRMINQQLSSQLNISLGSNSEKSWFLMGQMGTCYVGEPRRLVRDAKIAGAGGLDPDSVFNFFTGLRTFILAGDLPIAPETGAATVTIDGRDIACQVFKTLPAPNNDEQTIYFDPASNLVLQIHLISHVQRQGVPMEQRVRISMDSYTLNEDVAEDVFAFTQPGGVKVVNTLAKLTNPDSMVGDTAPDISFKDFTGKTINLADYRGKVVFLDFWATWCGPCRMEMPHLEALHKELDPGGEVVFIGASNEDQATVEKFLAKSPFSFQMVLVGKEDAFNLFKVQSIPAGFVIDKDGVIRAHLIGAQNEEQLRRALAKAGVGD